MRKIKFRTVPRYVTLVALATLGACSDSAPPVTAAVEATNVASKPIFLKDLSTGIVFDSKKFPRPYLSMENARRLKYEYFGDLRDTEILLNGSKQIYSVRINLGLFAEEIVGNLEAKLSSEAGAPVNFKCRSETISLEAMGIKDSRLETKQCVVVHDSQRLTVEVYKPLGIAATTRIDMHGGKITLVDTKLAAAAEQEKDEREKRESLKKSSKRASDI